MPKVQDVAEYILIHRGPMTAMKVQKLCYYSQAWHLVWDEEPLFGERIEAWANGPVAPALYHLHRGRMSLAAGDLRGDADTLSLSERGTVDEVLDFYGGMSAHQLSELTHLEAPWRDARAAAGLQPMDRGNAEITPVAMFEFYDSLTHDDEEIEV